MPTLEFDGLVGMGSKIMSDGKNTFMDNIY